VCLALPLCEGEALVVAGVPHQIVTTGDGDGPGRDELVLGGAVLAVGVPDAAAHGGRVVHVQHAGRVAAPYPLERALHLRSREPPPTADARPPPPQRPRRALDSSLLLRRPTWSSLPLPLPR